MASLSVQCGCDAVRESEKEAHPGNRVQQADAGRDLQRRLRCPVPCDGAFPEDRRGLDSGVVRMIDTVERLTGATDLTTCPKAYACKPDVNAAMLYRNRRDAHWLGQTAPPALSARLVRGIELIDRAYNARTSAEIKAATPPPK